jgi:hypothetical protein
MKPRAVIGQEERASVNDSTFEALEEIADLEAGEFF